MADYCKECSEYLFGEGFGDFEGLAIPGEQVYVLCEACGPIYVDHEGKRTEQRDETSK